MSEKDGGPAFPCRIPSIAAAVGPTIGDEWEQSAARRCPPKVQSDPPMMWSSGMSLRDYFAGQAMQAALGNQSMLDRMRAGVGGDLTNAHEWLAEGSYLVADSMLKERAKV